MATTATATYGADLTKTKDQVRFLLGDTGPKFELADSEVAWLLVEHDDKPYFAAAAGAQQLAARYAGEESSRSLGDLSVSRDARSKAGEFRQLARHLKEQAAIKGGFKPTAGGIEPSSVPRGGFDNARAGWGER